MAWNKITRIMAGLAIMGSMNAAHAGALYESYLCSLKVIVNGTVTVDLRDQEVRVPIAGAPGENAIGVEAFEAVSGALQNQIHAPVFFHVKTVPVRHGGKQFSELNLGVYFYNKFEEKARMLHHEASGDARAFAKLKTKLASSPKDIQFTCRHKDYYDI